MNAVGFSRATGDFDIIAVAYFPKWKRARQLPDGTVVVEYSMDVTSSSVATTTGGWPTVATAMYVACRDPLPPEEPTTEEEDPIDWIGLACKERRRKGVEAVRAGIVRPAEPVHSAHLRRRLLPKYHRSWQKSRRERIGR